MLRLALIAAALLLPLAAMNAAAAEESGPKVDRAWARATPGAARTGAAYFRIKSPIDDRLIGLASPVAGKAELHTHSEENGIMRMRMVEGGVAVLAAQVLELKPGGPLHVMLTDLKQPLKVGGQFSAYPHVCEGWSLRRDRQSRTTGRHGFRGRPRYGP